MVYPLQFGRKERTGSCIGHDRPNEYHGFYEFYRFDRWVTDPKKKNEPRKRYRGDDSPWYTIGQLMHYFPQLTWNDILYKMTYKNLLMLMATIPDPDLEET